MIAKILIQDEDEDKTIYTDFFFDEKIIKGYYLTKENHLDKSVNIWTDDGVITLKQSDELIDYLLKRFSNA